MFEKLDEINWEQFGDTHIATGMKAVEIPICVRNMLNEDPDEREYAIACLLGEGQHLGMLDDATPHIIPYVLEVLADQHYEQRWYLMLGIAAMFDHMFHYQSFDYLRLTIKIYDEIKKGYPLYKHLLNDTDQIVRLSSVEIMTYMQDNSVDALAALLTRLKVELDVDIRGKIITGMIKLVKDSLSPYVNEGRENIMALFEYIKNDGSFEEKVQFARSLKEVYFSHDKDIKIFMEQILAQAESMK